MSPQRGRLSDFDSNKEEGLKKVGDQTIEVTITAHTIDIKSTSEKNSSEKSVYLGYICEASSPRPIMKPIIEVSDGVGNKTVVKGNKDLYTAIDAAAARALADGLSNKEAIQFNNLRAYIADHCKDGKFDANEIGAAIQRANNIAPAKGR